jgi:nucleoside-diphosphate-sugar epimerase
MKASRPDIVFHTATHGAYPQQKDRQTILSTTIFGMANLLNALEPYGECTLVNCGSSSEYGLCDRPMRETDPLHPHTDYAVGKAAATLLCQSEAYRGRPIVTVRLFSAYGPWEEPTRLVPYVMDCCHRGEAPRVGDGSQPRDFIYIDDVIDLLRIAAFTPQLHAGTILHAGTGLPQTTRDIVDTIIAVCGNGLEAHYGAIPNRPGEPKTWVADITRTTELTGWRPRHSLRSGVEAMWAWHCRRASAA